MFLDSAHCFSIMNLKVWKKKPLKNIKPFQNFKVLIQCKKIKKFSFSHGDQKIYPGQKWLVLLYLLFPLFYVSAC